MILVITGNGKGKTTSAIGQMIRVLGHGKRVLFIQFIKHKDFPTGEDKTIEQLGDMVTAIKGGRGFVGILGDTLPFTEHQEAAQDTLVYATELATTGLYDLVVLDEVNVAVHLKLISVEDVITFVQSVPIPCDVVLTGRYADQRIIELADYVTECVEVKHPFAKKIPAQKGIEY